MQAANERLAQLARERTEALLGDDDKVLDRVEAALTATLRDRDRAELAATELRRRHAEALAAEEQARLDALHAAALEAQQRAVTRLHRDYPKIAGQLVKLARELEELGDAIDAANRALTQAGDPRRVEHWEQAARPRAPGQHLEPFLRLLELPAGDAARGTLWPPVEPAAARSAA